MSQDAGLVLAIWEYFAKCQLRKRVWVEQENVWLRAQVESQLGFAKSPDVRATRPSQQHGERWWTP